MPYRLEEARYLLPQHEMQAQNALVEVERTQGRLVKTLSQLFTGLTPSNRALIHFDYQLPEPWKPSLAPEPVGGVAQSRDTHAWGLYGAYCNGYKVEGLRSHELLLLQDLPLADLLHLVTILRQGYGRVIPRGSFLQDLHRRWETFPVVSLEPQPVA